MPLPDITSKQNYFDQLVANTNCSSQTDKIACLRTVPFDKLGEAMNLSPGPFSYIALNLAWMPTVDGSTIKRNPQESIQQGLFAKVPIVAGGCDDEGPCVVHFLLLISSDVLDILIVYSLLEILISRIGPHISNCIFATSDVFASRTDAEFLGYMKTKSGSHVITILFWYLPYLSSYFQTRISDAQLAALGVAYPSDPAQVKSPSLLSVFLFSHVTEQGSPFDTGNANART